MADNAIKLSASTSPSATILHQGIFQIIAVIGKLSKFTHQKEFHKRVEYSYFAVALCQLPFVLSVNYPQSAVGFAAYECYALGNISFLPAYLFTLLSRWISTNQLSIFPSFLGFYPSLLPCLLPYLLTHFLPSLASFLDFLLFSLTSHHFLLFSFFHSSASFLPFPPSFPPYLPFLTSPLPSPLFFLTSLASFLNFFLSFIISFLGFFYLPTQASFFRLSSFPPWFPLISSFLLVLPSFLSYYFPSISPLSFLHLIPSFIPSFLSSLASSTFRLRLLSFVFVPSLLDFL